MLVKNIAKSSRVTRNATSASLIAIAALAMYNWMVTPHATYLSAAKGYDSAMDNIVKRNKVISKKVATKRKKLQKLREQSAQLQSMLFTPDQAREFFSDLQTISEETGCTVLSLSRRSVKDGPPEASGAVGKSAMLSVVGLYGDIARLIEKLQARTQKVWIYSVMVQTLDRKSNQPRCDMTITIFEISDKDML